MTGAGPLRSTMAILLFPGDQPSRGFAVGDVRSGSIKRVASAVGEGSMAIRLVHDRLRPLA